MALTITPIYAGIIGLLFILLSTRVIVYRRANRISLGDAGDKNLLKRMRAQANCAEYAPMGLLLLALAELAGAPGVAVHTAGITLLAGRVMHAYGFASTPQKMGLRVGGMMLTLIMIALTALGLIGHGLL